MEQKTTFRPATFIYNQYQIPRSMLRDLSEDGVVRVKEKLSIDGVNVMKLYCMEDIEAYLSDDKD